MSVQMIALESDRSRVIEIAKLLRGEAERLIALKKFFEVGDTESAFGALGSFIEGHVATVIKGAVIEAMAMVCARAWDNAGRDLFTFHSARCALANIDTFNFVASQGNQAALNNFICLVDEMKNDYSRLRVRDFRNYRLAHHIPDKLTKADTPKLQHLWNVIDDTLRVTFFLGSGVGTTTVSFDSVGEIWRERCHAYWHRLIGGPQGPQAEK